MVVRSADSAIDETGGILVAFVGGDEELLDSSRHEFGGVPAEVRNVRQSPIVALMRQEGSVIGEMTEVAPPLVESGRASLDLIRELT
ncbi:hypothetical protein CLV30_101417 [Haloactinopolyspora alba]|uniref:Uncharacterized protein n=1 Tax=Haloactinopolyspora alba TaxID=648780 RepID=A0A2P8EG48_9ACTN|nr:hypothetical protein CLV30_101417 [Haloactinopolyspora alba]